MGCAVAIVQRHPGPDPAVTRSEWMLAAQVLLDDELTFELQPPEAGGGVRWTRKTDGKDARDQLLELVLASGGLPAVGARQAAQE